MSNRRPDLQIASTAIVDSYKAGASASSLARQHHTDTGTIVDIIKRAGVGIRTSKEQVEKHLFIRPEMVEEFTGLMDGLLLGDGSISPFGQFRLSQTDARRAWLDIVAERLAGFGVSSRIVPHGKARRVRLKDERFVNSENSSVLYTPCYREMKDLRARWYPDGIKHVPADVVMTPLGLAYWFCGDGTADKRGVLSLCTNCFSEHNVIALSEKLSVEFDVAARCVEHNRTPHLSNLRDLRGRREFLVRISKRDDAQRFKELTEMHVPACFLYKFKYVRRAIPRGSTGAKLSYALAREIRNRFAAGTVSQASLARKYGVTPTAIKAVLRGWIYQPTPSELNTCGDASAARTS